MAFLFASGNNPHDSSAPYEDFNFWCGVFVGVVLVLSIVLCTLTDNTNQPESSTAEEDGIEQQIQRYIQNVCPTGCTWSLPCGSGNIVVNIAFQEGGTEIITATVESSNTPTENQVQ